MTTACSSAGAPTTGPADTHCQGVMPQTINAADCDVVDAGPPPSDDAGAGEDGGTAAGPNIASIDGSTAALGPSANVGAPATTITIAGTGFVSASTVSFNGTAIATTYVSATSLTAVIPATALATSGAFPVVVTNPGASGGASSPYTFFVEGPCDENGPDGAYGSTHFNTEGNDDDCKYQVSYSATPICENNGTYFIVNASYLTRTDADGGLAPLTGASTFAEVCLSSTHLGPTANNRPPTGSQVVVEGPPGTYTIGPVEFDAPGDWTVRFHFNEYCCDVADDSPHGHAAFSVTVT
jgi:hypothetical protein